MISYNRSHVFWSNFSAVDFRVSWLSSTATNAMLIVPSAAYVQKTYHATLDRDPGKNPYWCICRKGSQINLIYRWHALILLDDIIELISYAGTMAIVPAVISMVGLHHTIVLCYLLQNKWFSETYCIWHRGDTPLLDRKARIVPLRHSRCKSWKFFSLMPSAHFFVVIKSGE